MPVYKTTVTGTLEITFVASSKGAATRAAKRALEDGTLDVTDFELKFKTEDAYATEQGGQ